MFAPYCEQHASQVLLSTTAITALKPTEGGLLVYFTCTCGHRGIWKASA
jgi:hypothetical protein